LTLHVFAEKGLMLAETSFQDLAAIEGVRCTEFAVGKVPGWRVRVVQMLHILTRPVSLAVSAHFAKRFNAYLRVEPAQLAAGLAAIAPGDRVLWFNPSLAVQGVIEGLRDRGVAVHLYFLDPVHRLGLSPAIVRAWSSWARMASYSRDEAARLGIAFLAPYAPALAPSGKLADFDIVYVGSPSPKRLAWVLYLQARLRANGRTGHLRLASRNQRLVAWFPGVFSGRISFAQYAQLCARARSVLELHERDAGGVTLRATLCQSLGVVHLCNQTTTPQTLQLSLSDPHALDRFLRQGDSTPSNDRTSAPALDAPHFDAWLRHHFA
jgi:hypothetical protein